jgi:uncharacterized membrane protein
LRIRIENELFLINILAILLILVITFFPLIVLRIIFGLPFLLFFPGYVLALAFFPKKDALDPILRVVLSFGLSIAVVPLIGLILNYTPWGIKLYPILFSLTFFTMVISAIAWYRRHRLSPEERWNIAFEIPLPRWGKLSPLDKALSILLAVSILGAIGTLGYVTCTPKVGERFTEFYVLGLGGIAADYPEELAVGEEGRVILGIVNHEYKRISYWVRIMINRERVKEIGPIMLDHKEKWEEEVGFVPQKPGEQKVEFLLYKGGDDEPYNSIHLWIDVRSSK